MADVVSRNRGERGQLLLITALALAVILLTVALLLNAAVYTENVATRETAADSRDAIAFRGEAVDGVADLIETENRGGGDTAAVAAGINAMGPLVDRQQARAGVVANISFNGTTEGKRVSDNLDNSGDWTVVDGLGDARNFTVRVDPGELPDSPSNVEDNAFGVRFVNKSEGNVTQYLHNESGDLVVEQTVDGGTADEQCRIAHDDTNTTVDLSGSRLSTDDSDVDCFRSNGLWPADPPEAIE
ncbi:MAG: hypothetical protein R6V31_09420, partial [Halohasta sp.]